MRKLTPNAFQASAFKGHLDTPPPLHRRPNSLICPYLGRIVLISSLITRTGSLEGPSPTSSLLEEPASNILDLSAASPIALPYDTSDVFSRSSTSLRFRWFLSRPYGNLFRPRSRAFGPRALGRNLFSPRAFGRGVRSLRRCNIYLCWRSIGRRCCLCTEFVRSPRWGILYRCGVRRCRRGTFRCCRCVEWDVVLDRVGSRRNTFLGRGGVSHCRQGAFGPWGRSRHQPFLATQPLHPAARHRAGCLRL